MEEIKMLGKIEMNIITDLSKLPQKIATAMGTIENPDLVGSSFKAVMYVGSQPVRGTNYWFIAEETLTTANFDKHLVLMAVNEYENEYEIVKSNIVRVI